MSRTGAAARPAGRLASIRRVDWRFLLPDAAFDSVLVFGPADEVLMTAMGAPLGNEYVKVRRAEAAAFGEKDQAFELDQHFFKY